jgi:hypothetical protein
MLNKITSNPVNAHNVEVTAESIPPEIPITNPFELALRAYSFNQFTMCCLINFVFKMSALK